MPATIEWTEEKDRSRVFFRATTSGDTNDSLSAAFDEVRRKLAADVLPKHKPSDWDCLRVELWPDSGRLILYPGSTNSSTRSEKAGCELVVQALLDFWESLADAEIGDDDFSLRVRNEERRYAELMLHAWDQKQSVLESAPRPIRVLFFDAEASTPFLESVLPASLLPVR